MPTAVTAGGANVIIFHICENIKRAIAVRLSVVGASTAKPAFFKFQDLLEALPNKTNEQALEFLLRSFKLFWRIDPKEIIGGYRRLIRPTEIDGEQLWRAYFAWQPLTFGVALPTASCRVCIRLLKTLPIYDDMASPIAEIGTADISVEIFHEVDGAAGRVLEHLGRETLLVLLIGYVNDVDVMAGRGLLHDCHLGNLLIDHKSHRTPIVKWHDFARSLWTPHPSQSTLREFADHVNTSVSSLIEKISEIAAPRLAARLSDAQGSCWLPMDSRLADIRLCLQDAALAMLTAVVDWDDTTQLSVAAKSKILDGVGSLIVGVGSDWVHFSSRVGWLS